MLASSLNVLAVAALSLASFVAGQGASTNKAGWSGALMNTDAGLAGTVSVVDDKTLKISNYKLADASAPALYWWGAVDGNLKGGFRISNAQVTKAASSDSLTIVLDAGKTTADFTTVGLWCERFSANFGQASLKPSDGTVPTTGPSVSAGTTPSSGSTPMQSTKPGAGVANHVSLVAVGALAAAALFASSMA